MPYPDKDKIAKERREFDEGGGPKYVRDQILSLPSIGKHKRTGEPWPAFHRCTQGGMMRPQRFYVISSIVGLRRSNTRIADTETKHEQDRQARRAS